MPGLIPFSHPGLYVVLARLYDNFRQFSPFPLPLETLAPGAGPGPATAALSAAATATLPPAAGA